MKNINDKIMFIHIPKAAGSSITKTLDHRFNWNACSPEKWKPLIPGAAVIRHDPLFLLEKKNDLSEFYIFAVSRNPYTRVYSLYKHYSARSETIKMNFQSFLSMLLDKKHLYDESHFTSTIPHFRYFIHYTQSFFVKDSTNKIAVDKIYRQENIAELESDFQISLPKLNAPKYFPGEFKQSYTPKAIELVQQIYHEDFINFNYSLDFNEVLPNELH